MTSARWRLGLAGAVLLAVVAGRGADLPGGDDAKMPREPEKAAAPDESKPGTVILTQKEYQDLLDRIARPEGPAKAEPPSTCKVTGRAAGDLAHLRVEFGFRTLQRNARVALACTQAYPSDAKIDGHPPQLKWGADGLSVQVEDASDHLLVLDLDLPLAAREKGGERGLDLDLPAAVVTTLELELPAGVKKAQVRTALRGATGLTAPEVKAEPGGNGSSRVTGSGLGPVERLEVSWEVQAAAAGPPLLSVTAGRVVVRVDERNVTTHAEITVGVRRGQVKELQLLVPPQAVIRGPEGDDRVVRIDPPGPKGGPHVVHLKPTSDPLTLTVSVQQPRSGGAIPVGPFVVLGAFPQSGDIAISPPSDTILDYHAKGESQYLLTQREPTEREKQEFPNVLALHYSTLPGVEKASPLPFLELEADRHKGVLEARISHTLRLVRGEGERPGAWRVATTIEARPYHTEPEQLLIGLPAVGPEYTFDEGAGPQPANEVQVGEVGKRTAQLLLTGRRKGPFKVTFEGQYAAPAADAGQMAVALPGLVTKKIEGPAQVSVALPPDLELVPPRPGALWDAGKPDGPNKRTWTFDRWPERFEVAWQPYRPPLIVNGEARVTIAGRQATVSHRFWLPPGQAPPERLPLNVPAEVVNLTAAGDNAARLDGKEGGPRAVPPPLPTDRDHPLVLEYSFRLPERPGEPFPVPLVGVRTATGGETRVCVWTDPGSRPELKDKEGRWEVRRTEEVKGEERYPSLVLLSRQPGAPLALGLGEAGGVALAAFRVERALIQATVADTGQQSYRARFLLTQVAAPSLDVELPAPLFRHNAPDVKVLLAGKDAAWEPVDDAGKATAVSKTARVQVPPAVAGKSVVLDVSYTLLPGRGVLQTALPAPQLRGDPGAAPVRWQVVLPPSWVPLSPDAVGPEHGWGRRGWLVALHPTVTTADFERWFAGSDAPPADAAKYPDPAVAAWRSAPEPLRVSHVPQQPWLLVCSLTLLIVGVALAFLSLPRSVFWGTLAVLGVAALLAGLFWPGVLGAVLYGCQPGALVLLPVLGVQWLMHQRYRRQVVFLPGFTRVKAGSSLGRGGSRPRGEPSTVDAAPPAPSGQRPAGADSGSKKTAADGS